MKTLQLSSALSAGKFLALQHQSNKKLLRPLLLEEDAAAKKKIRTNGNSSIDH